MPVDGLDPQRNVLAFNAIHVCRNALRSTGIELHHCGFTHAEPVCGACEPLERRGSDVDPLGRDRLQREWDGRRLFHE
jgi:hypothetical protein